MPRRRTLLTLAVAAGLVVGATACGANHTSTTQNASTAAGKTTGTEVTTTISQHRCV